VTVAAKLLTEEGQLECRRGDLGSFFRERSDAVKQLPILGTDKLRDPVEATVHRSIRFAH
jgi:hypothetical protein